MIRKTEQSGWRSPRDMAILLRCFESHHAKSLVFGWKLFDRTFVYIFGSLEVVLASLGALGLYRLNSIMQLFFHLPPLRLLVL